MDALKEFVELDTRKRQLDADLKAIKADMEVVEVEVLDYFVDQGIQSLKLDGRTYSIRADRRSGKLNPADPPAVICQKLRDAGFGDFVSTGVGWQSLTSLFSERDDNGETPVPKELADVLQLHVKHKITSRKS